LHPSSYRTGGENHRITESQNKQGNHRISRESNWNGGKGEKTIGLSWRVGYTSRRGLLSWGEVEDLGLSSYRGGCVGAPADPCLGDGSRSSWSLQLLAQAQAMQAAPS